MTLKKKKPTAFVPRMIVTGVVLGVVPACAIVACSSSSTTTATQQAKDATPEGSDQDVQFIALAQQGFDASTDG